MPKRVTKERIREQIPDFIEIDWSTYKFVHTKTRFIDKEFGEFWCAARDLMRGRCFHRLRANKSISQKKKMSLDDVKLRLPPFITIVDETYQCFYKKAKFIDKNYGEFISSPKVVCKIKSEIQPGFRGKLLGRKRNGRLTADDIQNLLPQYIKIDKESYQNTTDKCRFIDDEYGEFFARPNAVIHHKTGHKLRGFYNSKRKAKITTIKNHWKDNRELVCQASYECAVVDYLNENKIDFDWQIPFKFDKYYYIVDLYLIEEDKYIEIKGWWRREESKQKWLKFHELYPNSEVWFEKDLKEKNILKSKPKKNSR